MTQENIPEPQEQRTENRITEQKCPECENWFRKRGYANHVRSCMDIDEETEQEETDFEEVIPEQEETEELEIKEVCPECGSELALSKDLAKVYRDMDHVQFAETVSKYDYACTDCEQDSITLFMTAELKEGDQQ